MPDSLNTQTAPYPTELADLVSTLAYRPEWAFELRHLDRGQGLEHLVSAEQGESDSTTRCEGMGV